VARVASDGDVTALFALRRSLDRALLAAGLWPGAEPELALLPRLCDPARGFLDVGANRGRWSRAARSFAARVYAAEPDPALAAALARLGPRVQVLPVALGERPGRAPFFVPEVRGAPLSTRGSLVAGADPELPCRRVEVEVHRLDDEDLPALGAALGILIANLIAWVFILRRIARALGRRLAEVFPWSLYAQVVLLCALLVAGIELGMRTAFAAPPPAPLELLLRAGGSPRRTCCWWSGCGCRAR